MNSTLQKSTFAYIKGEITLDKLLETEPNFGELHKILLYIYKNTKFVAKEKMYRNFVALEDSMVANWNKYNRIITITDNYFKFKNHYLPKKVKIGKIVER